MDKKYFTTEQGDKVDVIEHTKEQMEKWPGLKVYVGTDSQDYGGISRYVTTVVYRYGHRGAHYIYVKDEVPRIKDMFARLYNEAVKTIEIAQYIDSQIDIIFEALEFDYNNVPRWASNRLMSSVRGWVKGLNYKAVFKNNGDDMIIACKAADHICRK